MDARVADYLDGEHHPQQALAPRIAYAALDGEEVVGYIAGHLTRRFGYEGELQYLYVEATSRRLGIATRLLRFLARWFRERGVKRVCVNADIESPGAGSFYRRHGAAPLTPHWYAWEDIRVVLEAHDTLPAG